MLRSIVLTVCMLGFCVLLAGMAQAQSAPQVLVDTSETLFSVLAGINACGYDQELSASDPVRAQVRAEMAEAAQASERAKSSLEELCAFYRDHQQASASQDLAQYVSLALNVGEPPAFTPQVKEADMPPDASYVLGMLPRLQRFYINTDLHQIWARHHREYETLLDQLHAPLSKMILATDAYLKKPSGNFGGHRFVVYLDPMAAPSQINSRNYANDYFLTVAPSRAGVRMGDVRHTYLHFLLDPMAAQRGRTMQQLAPLLDEVKTAPMDEPFKEDIPLLVTECLIQAIEARMAAPGKTRDAENERHRLAQVAAQEGFVLAPYFEQQLAVFEKSEEGLQIAYPNWLHDIDVDRESKRAAKIVFAGTAGHENVQRAAKGSLLDGAERRLAAGDIKGANELARQALEEKREDQGRALFVLAQAAAAGKDMNGALDYFQRTLSTSHEPRLIAWSHIYLGRIFDLQGQRQQALEHYRAALQLGDAAPATRAAAERGMAQPYERPAAGGQRPAAADKEDNEPDDSRQ